jgi:flagellin-like protein
MKRRLFSNKKAVSPVIATVLMIMVTMAGMTILFGFVISYSDSYKAGIGSQISESLTVEDVWLSPGTSYALNADHTVPVQLSIYNVGKVSSTITSIYADGSKLTDSSDYNGNFNLNLKLAVGEHKQITLYWNQAWTTNETYTFTIATKTGSSFEMTYRAP